MVLESVRKKTRHTDSVGVIVSFNKYKKLVNEELPVVCEDGENVWIGISCSMSERKPNEWRLLTRSVKICCCSVTKGDV